MTKNAMQFITPLTLDPFRQSSCDGYVRTQKYDVGHILSCAGSKLILVARRRTLLPNLQRYSRRHAIPTYLASKAKSHMSGYNTAMYDNEIFGELEQTEKPRCGYHRAR